jgi:uncharacterized protein (TIGR00725 family)
MTGHEPSRRGRPGPDKDIVEAASLPRQDAVLSGATARGRPLYAAVIGAGDVLDGSPEVDAAEAVGRGLAEAGAVVVCGGLPGSARTDANPWVSVALPTGLGEARNALVVRAVDVVVAVGGGYGTLSEIGLALRTGTPVVGLGTWELSRAGEPDDGVERVATAGEAVRRALELAGGGA